MSAATKFRKGIARVLRQCAAGHQLAISAGDVEGTGPRVLMTAGTAGVMMGVKEARHLAEIYSCREAIAAGLGEIAAELREAADVCEARSGPLQ